MHVMTDLVQLGSKVGQMTQTIQVTLLMSHAFPIRKLNYLDMIQFLIDHIFF